MKTLDINGFLIDRICEIERMPVDPKWLFPGITDEEFSCCKQALDPRAIAQDGVGILFNVQSFLIRANGKNILIDACNGNHKHRPAYDWMHERSSQMYMEAIARLGLRATDIDVVMCTHLHADHVGWNTSLRDGRWLPTFPNARYIWSRQEFEHFERRLTSEPSGKVNHGSFSDSVLPVADAGLMELVDASSTPQHIVTDGLTVVSAAGHSPGHLLFQIESMGREAAIVGDIIHHPLQFVRPHICSLSDWDADLAAATRKALVEGSADRDRVLLAAHFPSPTAGRVVTYGDSFNFRFVDQ